MRDVVVIEKYPQHMGYHYVFFNGNLIGGIYSQDAAFVPYRPYDHLLDCDKELVNEHVDEFICVLEITNRLTE